MEANNSISECINILAVGNSRVGKSSIIRRQCDNDFHPVYFPTVGIERSVTSVKSYGKHLNIHAWDLTGTALKDSPFLQNFKPFISATKGVFFIYDITNEKSFLDISRWVLAVESICDQNVQKILLGNKVDRYNERAVSKEMGEALANLHQMRFFEVSAFSRGDTNIRSAFCMMGHDSRKAFDSSFAARFETDEYMAKDRSTRRSTSRGAKRTRTWISSRSFNKLKCCFTCKRNRQRIVEAS